MKNIFVLSTLCCILLFAFTEPNSNFSSHKGNTGNDSLELKRGEKLFTSNCSLCHSINNSKLIGPTLFEIEKKHERVWLINYIKNDEKFSKIDKTAHKKREQSSFVDHQNFEEFLSEHDINLILDYIKSKSE